MTKTILIVEDNDLNLKLFEDILQMEGYKTISTKSGLNAAEIAKDKLPDLVIMDIQLPGISGLEVTKKIKQQQETQNIPVMAVTAFAMKGDEDKIRASGCKAYISKPIEINHFLEETKKLLIDSSKKQHN